MITRLQNKPEPAAVQQPAWTVEDAAELYHVDAWCDGFFFINEAGHVAVRPIHSKPYSIDIFQVVQRLQAKGVDFPVLIRFQDILNSRVSLLNQAFADAREAMGYGNRYVGVYPIKVNQLHEVVKEILEAGKPFGLGLECGSKAELVAALPHLEDDGTLLICNGYKDASMLRLILAGQKLGKQVIPVIERYREFEDLLALSDEMGAAPKFGVRIRVSTNGVGKWAASAGDSGKFGISIPELVSILERLRHAGLEHALILLHFHLGSQITDIQAVKLAVKEITQIYVELRKRAIPVCYIDVGGGLGVNYDVGHAHSEDSINYSLQEYANSVVYAVKEVCDAAEVPHPVIISESGRALTAHHSVLIVDVQGAYRKEEIDASFKPTETDEHVVNELYNTWEWVKHQAAGKVADLLEAYHDAVEKRAQAASLFSLGYLSLEQKAVSERLFWSICQVIDDRVKQSGSDHVPAELTALEDLLIDQYLCDFSVFQSMLDYWAIGQRFPIVPLHRLDKRPMRRAILIDLTCDSDGKVDEFIAAESEKDFLEVHEIKPDESYFLGFFLMGAYQDIMGDMHNLFGRVSEAHVYADPEEPDGFYIEKLIRGATVEEMLALVQYFPNDLHRRMNSLIREKIQSGVIRPSAGIALFEQYKKAFTETTYYRNLPLKAER